ncbi:FAD dependent oxidoreductase [Plesiocystis pacifica SIR-1]|uniref:FAD dependent oxidoreductase n=1 Tax=Plesiocystis pacifica SIR-1 TaxID=391625 RepID=A6G3Y2_9BACT|nr:FAD-dependent oxidoreductase [Plesiocystis pacifica]EDM79519.1 FAD dependent oxidoreductase [Plesiocystis pacifica SIR-1]
MPAPSRLPDRARVVVIGGGVIGCSVAYHLAHMGETDVVLLERDKLTSGTTWHAAGLMVCFGSTSETSMEMRKYTRDLYARLEAETGQATGFAPVGFIELASDADRLEEYRRVSAFNRHCGVDVEEIGPAKVKEMFPLAEVEDVLAGFYVEGDGRVNPVDVTQALAKGARLQGATIFEEVRVTGVTQARTLELRGSKVTGVDYVRTVGGQEERGHIEAEVVVNCTGMWARQLAGSSGISVPLQAAEHYYLITEAIPELGADWPVIEDPGCYGYYREEGGGLMIGLFEPVCAPWKVEGIPQDFSFGTLSPDWDRMGPYLEKAMSRVPIAYDTGVKLFFCGPESFTPDLSPIVGEAPEVKNYFVAAGLNSIGILTGGGLGRVLAHWILTGRADVDITAMNVDRLQPYQCTPEYRATRTVESLGMVYQCHYPMRSMQTARGAKRSPFYEALKAQGAYFRDVSGWEGADWYAGPGVEPDPGPLSWGKPRWFDRWAAEHKACREGVIVMDMSFMAKFMVQGRDAGACLERVSANRVDGKVGRITYTQWLDEAGKLQADLTVTKLGPERYLVIASDTAHRHAETWMVRNFPADAHVFVSDVSSGYAQLNVQGPRSRALMQAITDADMSKEAFPFRGVRELAIGFATVICTRITYLGELGYELYIPTEQAMHVYERIVAAGAQFGLVHAGLKALASLRMEKAYRDYGHDIDNTDTVLEAGLGFAVRLKKKGGFIGRDAVAAQKAAGPLAKQLVQILLTDPEPMLFHAELVYRDGACVGYIRAASYGHTLGGAVGLAMIESGDGSPVDADYVAGGTWEVLIGNERYPAKASLAPMYDPKMARIKA